MFDEDQSEGFGFAVLISSISQINALNRTDPVQSSGIYLSAIINNALNDGNATIISVINDIRNRNNNDTTPLIVYAGANFSGLNLSGRNFTGANFTGANLTNVNFTGANLTNANFKYAVLTNVIFTGANLTDVTF